jgi:hypothetical protein
VLNAKTRILERAQRFSDAGWDADLRQVCFPSMRSEAEKFRQLAPRQPKRHMRRQC